MKRLPHTEPFCAEAARLGAELRDARFALGLSLEGMAAGLRIRQAYLEALEDGRLRALPAPAYVFGFVRSYAAALGLDADDMVAQYQAVTVTGAARPVDLVFPQPVPERSVPAGAVMLAGAVLMLGAYAAWFQWSGSEIRTVDAVPPMPARLAMLAEPPPAVPAQVVAESVPAPVQSIPALTLPNGPRPAPPGPPSASAATIMNGPVIEPSSPEPPAASASLRPDEPRVQLRARAEAWVQLRDRGGNQVLVNRVLKPGETLPVPPRPGLLLTTGNAPGLDILVDGEPAPPFQGSAAVRRDIPVEVERLKAGNYAPEAVAAAALAPRPAPKPYRGPVRPEDAAYEPQR